MASDTNNTQWYKRNLGFGLTMPISFAGWVNMDSAAAACVIISGYSKTGPALLTLELSKSVQAYRVRMQSWNGSSQAASPTTTFTNGQNSHCCGVLAAANSRSAWLNGGSKTTNSNNLAFATPLTWLGLCVYDVGTTESTVCAYDGRLSYPAVWDNYLLSDADVSSLYEGCSPLLIAPHKLISCVRFTEGQVLDLCGGTWVTTGTPGQADDVRIYGPN
jgi:Concanavalin A-like lectin/glucanases superfamily